MTRVSKKQLKIGSKTTAITKKYTLEETRDLIKKVSRVDCDPELILKELGEDILPKFISGNQKEQKETKKILEEKSMKAMMALGMETHFPLLETVESRYRPLAMEFSRNIICEFDCKTNHEKALAQLVVNAYIRVIDNSRRFNNCLEAGEYLSNERNGYLAVISKQIDRANRQFIVALTTLKQIKEPSLEINVKAKTAFISKNQQINVVDSLKSTNNETNEPK